uniref:Calcium-transporting P-type ATPase N-terminal autoinhibitory domain-containing protein n=3 Tax=Aegilops tauschii subsp. strangulata TaxID=200361 RepID=A0A453NIX9_AEGTS
MPAGGVGVQAPEASPGRYVRRVDEVPPDDDGCDGVFGVDVRGPGDNDPFDIPAKRAPVERLRRWRQAALVLNASRRFRYTLDLKKEEEKEQIRRKIRAHAQVIRVCVQAFVSAVYVFYHHTLFFFDALVLNSIRLHYCSRKQEKSRMVIRNYQKFSHGGLELERINLHR